MRVRFDEAKRPLFTSLVAATVQVTYTDSAGRPSKGTGVLVSSDGVVLTAWHVVTRARVVRVRMLRLSRKGWHIRLHGRYLADVVYRDHDADIAVLKIRKPKWIPYIATVGRFDPPTIGCSLIRVGCDCDGRRIAEGHVISYSRVIRKRMSSIDISMHSNSGMSGGPVYDKEGRLVGIALWAHNSRTESPWCSFLPMDLIQRRLNRRKEVLAVLPHGVT